MAGRLAGAADNPDYDPVAGSGESGAALSRPLLLGLSFVIVPAGSAGVVVSQVSGTEPRALYPGVHWILPLVENMTLYDTRERVFTRALGDNNRDGLQVQIIGGRVGPCVDSPGGSAAASPGRTTI